MWSWLVLVESNTTGTGRQFAAAGRALGLRPVLLTTDPSRYPYVAQDHVEHVVVDTQDERALARVTSKLAAVAPVAGVLSSSEYYVATAAGLAARHGRPTDPDAVRRCRDKARQRRALSGLPGSPQYVECMSPVQAATAATRLGGNVIVKPCEGSGSEGVRECASPAEVAEWTRRLLAAGTNERGLPVPSRVLVEEVVHGPEYSVELLDGEVWGVTAKHLGGPPHFVETGHDFPAVVPEPQRHQLVQTACRAVDALGVQGGPAHVELRLRAAGPVVIEVNPRLAGGMIPRLVELSTGHDLVSAVVNNAVGGRPTPAPAPTSHASIRFLRTTHAGVVAAINGVDRARAIDGVVEVLCTTSVGERRHQHNSFRDRCGHVIAAGTTAVDAAWAAEAGRAAICIKLSEV